MRAICWVNGLLVSDSQNSWYAAFKLRLPALKEFKFLLHQVLLTDKEQTLFITENSSSPKQEDVLVNDPGYQGKELKSLMVRS